VNLLGDNIDTSKKNTNTSIDASQKVGLKINVKRTKYMLLSRQKNAWKHYDIKIVSRCFENMSQVKYLGTTATV
jgi:stress-induced morphogen